MIPITCPYCGKKLSIPEQYAGQKGKCNKCGGRITVPTLLSDVANVRDAAEQVVASSGLPDIRALQDPKNWLSVQKNREFAHAPAVYRNKSAARAALSAVHEVFPTVPDAYKPSGKTTGAAVATMLLFTVPLGCLLAIGVRLIVAVAVPVFWFLETELTRGMLTVVASMVGLVFLAVTETWACLLSAGVLVGIIGHRFSNRSPGMAVVAALITCACATYCLLVPGMGMVKQESHPGYDAQRFGIVVGGLVTAIVAATIAGKAVSRDRYCELTHRFLPRARSVAVDLSFAENLLALLANGEYRLIGQILPFVMPKTTGSRAQLVVDADEHVSSVHRSGYVDVWIHFDKRYSFREAADEQIEGQIPLEERIAESWLAYSAYLDPAAAHRVLSAIF